jgi:hypothetical protein
MQSHNTYESLCGDKSGPRAERGANSWLKCMILMVIIKKTFDIDRTDLKSVK